MTTHTLSAVDAAWLRMDEPTNLMTVTGMLLFDEHIDVHRLRRVLEDRLMAEERFRMRVVAPALGAPRWEEDPHFDLDAHVHRLGLPGPQDDGALRGLVADLLSTPLDRSKPLWQVHVVDRGAAGSAVVFRVHHCIADGIAQIHLLLALTDGPNGDDGHHRHASAAPGGLLGLVTHPRQLLGAGAQAALGAAALARITLSRPDPPSPIRGELGYVKQVGWSRPIGLDPLKTLGHRTGCTINDVVVAAATGALRRQFLAHGRVADEMELHAAVPVDLRVGDGASLGNHFGLVFLALPVGIADPRRRLFEVRRRMEELKHAPDAGVSLEVLGVLGRAPEAAQRLGIDFFGSKISLVMTNVPGPREVRTLAGLPIRTVMFWVPQSGHVGLGLSILSYAGEVRLGVCADAGLVVDPQAIADGFETEIDQLCGRSPRRRAAAPIMRTLP